MAYGSPLGFTMRNPNTQVTSAQLSAYLLQDASVYLDAALGGYFVVPFSANNQTINTLVYDVAELRARNRERDAATGEALRTTVNSMIGALCDGTHVMLLASSYTAATGSHDTLFYGPYTQMRSNPQTAPPWMQVYANRAGYLPTFTADDWEHQQVDPNLLALERTQRGLDVGS